MSKKVTVVLTADGKIDATKSTVTDAGMLDHVKQAVPFLREKDTVIVDAGMTPDLVQTAVIGGVGYLAYRAGAGLPLNPFA